jgi:hypothetical protein
MSAYIPHGCAQTIWSCAPKKESGTTFQTTPTTTNQRRILSTTHTTSLKHFAEWQKVGPNDTLVVIWALVGKFFIVMFFLHTYQRIFFFLDVYFLTTTSPTAPRHHAMPMAADADDNDDGNAPTLLPPPPRPQSWPKRCFSSFGP